MNHVHPLRDFLIFNPNISKLSFLKKLVTQFRAFQWHVAQVKGQRWFLNSPPLLSSLAARCDTIFLNLITNQMAAIFGNLSVHYNCNLTLSYCFPEVDESGLSPPRHPPTVLSDIVVGKEAKRGGSRREGEGWEQKVWQQHNMLFVGPMWKMIVPLRRVCTAASRLTLPVWLFLSDCWPGRWRCRWRTVTRLYRRSRCYRPEASRRNLASCYQSYD